MTSASLIFYVSLVSAADNMFLSPRKLLTARCPDGYFDQSYGTTYWWDCAKGCPGGAYATTSCNCACVLPDSVTEPPPTSTLFPQATTSTTITTRTFGTNANPFDFDDDPTTTTTPVTTDQDDEFANSGGNAFGGSNDNSTEANAQTTMTTTTTTTYPVTVTASAAQTTTVAGALNDSPGGGGTTQLIVTIGIGSNAIPTTTVPNYGPEGTRVPLTNLGKVVAPVTVETPEDDNLSTIAILAIVVVASCAVFVPVIMACFCRPSGSVQPEEEESASRKPKVRFAAEDARPQAANAPNMQIPLPQQVASSAPPPPPPPINMPPPRPSHAPVGPPGRGPPGVPTGMMTPQPTGFPDARKLDSGMKTPPNGTPRSERGNNGTPRTPTGPNGTPRTGPNGTPRTAAAFAAANQGNNGTPRSNNASPRTPTGPNGTPRSQSLRGAARTSGSGKVPPPPMMPGRPSMPPPGRPPPPAVRSQMSAMR